MSFYFQNRRLALAEKPERAGPFQLDGRRVTEEKGRGRGSSPSHDLGRDDLNNGNPRHRNGKFLQRQVHDVKYFTQMLDTNVL